MSKRPKSIRFPTMITKGGYSKKEKERYYSLKITIPIKIVRLMGLKAGDWVIVTIEKMEV